MRQLIVRFLNVAVIAAVLIGYNTVLDKRDKEDQIARLSAELETTEGKSAGRSSCIQHGGYGRK